MASEIKRSRRVILSIGTGGEGVSGPSKGPVKFGLLTLKETLAGRRKLWLAGGILEEGLGEGTGKTQGGSYLPIVAKAHGLAPLLKSQTQHLLARGWLRKRGGGGGGWASADSLYSCLGP